jgi:hypothetical protein
MNQDEVSENERADREPALERTAAQREHGEAQGAYSAAGR